MVRIEDLVMEYQDKVLLLGGGIKYGRDFNRLRVILKYHEDKSLVKAIVENIEDSILAGKVKDWMVA